MVGDVLKRARTLAFEGPEGLFAGLHRAVGYRQGAVEIEKRWEQEVDPDVYVISDAPWQPTLAYAPRGVARLWESELPGTGEAIEAGLGRAMGVSAGAVSQRPVPITAGRAGGTPS